MSKREDSAQLARSMQREAARLEDLVAAMRESRMAYVALRPSVMQAGVAAMQRIAADCRALAAERAGLHERLGRSLAAVAAGQPPELRGDLQRAGERLRRAAAAVRVENGVGARLLEFSRTAQENLMLSLYAPVSVRGYDRSARAVQGAARGSLVSGTL